jgi:hypothetical protein
MTIYVLKDGDKFQIEDKLTIFKEETVSLSFDEIARISGDDETQIGNYGHSAYFQIFTTGHHKVKVKHGIHVRYLHITVNDYVALKFNGTLSKPIPLSVH